MGNRTGKEKAALAAAFLIILVTFIVELAMLPREDHPPFHGKAVEIGAITPGE